MHKEFNEGVAAFRDSMDVAFDISPYKSCTLEYFCWRAGWEEALRCALLVGLHPRQMGCKSIDEE